MEVHKRFVEADMQHMNAFRNQYRQKRISELRYKIVPQIFSETEIKQELHGARGGEGGRGRGGRGRRRTTSTKFLSTGSEAFQIPRGRWVGKL